MAVERTHSILAFLAAAALMALTISVVVRLPANGNIRELLILAVAWAAILTSALAGRQRVLARLAAEAEPPPPVVEPPEPATSVPDLMPRELLAFAQEIQGVLQSDQLRLTIARRLPPLIGIEEVWAVTRFNGEQHIILPPGAKAGQPMDLLGSPRRWATFPMKAEGRTVGVLGVGLPARELTERETRLLETVAGIVARSLKTAHAFDAMRRATILDQLTGCATRAEGLRRLEAELRRAERSRTSVAVLMLDLDHFKSVNDQFGHNAGDTVLSSVGQMLLTTLRASDVRCRWGGEEFLIVMPESSVGRAQRASEALRERIATTPVRAGARSIRLTASIGVTLSRPGEVDLQKLIERADAALYRAKSAGRNRVKVVLGDFKGEAVAAGQTFPTAVPQWTGPERRNQGQEDRRRVPSPGRRRTDPGLIAGPWR